MSEELKSGDFVVKKSGKPFPNGHDMRYILLCIILIVMTGCASKPTTGWEKYSCEEITVLKGMITTVFFTTDGEYDNVGAMEFPEYLKLLESMNKLEEEQEYKECL